MPRRQESYQWTDAVATASPCLSGPRAAVLACWSFAIALARSCALSAVARWLARFLERPYHSLRRRLREWYLDAGHKSGTRRRQFDVTTCFAPLPRWIVRDWPHRRLALAFDPTTLDTRFVSLTVSVLYRGTALPVAWRILPGTARESWNAEGVRLLGHLRDALAADWLVVVFTDRGLWSKELFEAIVGLGWHPAMRVNHGGSFRPHGWHPFRPFRRLPPHPGMGVRLAGVAFATAGRGLPCTLWGWWEKGYAEPWLTLADLSPAQGDARWYALRGWIEQCFKDLKGGGLQWRKTRMTAADRAERLWLALAVAQVWLVRVGTAAEDREALPATGEPVRPRLHQAPPARPAWWRLQAVATRGHEEIRMALYKGRRLPLGRLTPEPWPAIPVPPGPTKAGAGSLDVAC